MGSTTECMCICWDGTRGDKAAGKGTRCPPTGDKPPITQAQATPGFMRGLCRFFCALLCGKRSIDQVVARSLHNFTRTHRALGGKVKSLYALPSTIRDVVHYTMRQYANGRQSWQKVAEDLHL